MLFRFSLYGFIKNQRYFESFLILAFRQKGMSFALIGLLIAFREIAINIMEIPTGAIADVIGRRRSMIASFAAYAVSFAIFGFSNTVWMLFAAMFFFSVGEAFRTGTHKAMIFDWLAREGRENEKIKVYGFTRSWSKMGSAVSVVIAGVIVFLTKDFSKVFVLSLFPCLINIINFLSYPSYLDDNKHENPSISAVWNTFWLSIRASIRNSSLRRLLVESMGYEGLYKTTKDYIQPVLKSMVLAIPICLAFDNMQRTAILVGAVYFVMYLLSSFASRNAYNFIERFKSEGYATRVLWLMNLVVFIGIAAGILTGLSSVIIIGFVLLSLFQNFWRPILIGRYASHVNKKHMATVLSIESQAKSFFVAATAPLIGLAVDILSKTNANLRFLPVALLGVVVSFIIFFKVESNKGTIEV